MEDKIALLHKTENVATITLNRPKVYNALNQELKSLLLSYLDDCKNDNKIRAIILTGSGKGFCSGADMGDLASQPTPRDVRDDLNANYGTLIRRITEMDKPIICAINGPMAGAGIGIGLACDYKIMASHASLRFAFVNIGLVSDAGSTWFLARTVGYTKALEIIYGGEKITADHCLEMGIVNKVVDADDLMKEVNELARKLAKKAPLAFRATKRTINYALNHGLFDTISFEADEQMSLIASKDHKEGVMAFIEKRPAEFKGE